MVKKIILFGIKGRCRKNMVLKNVKKEKNFGKKKRRRRVRIKDDQDRVTRQENLKKKEKMDWD